jgi:leucyl/phenylalanyl-tRNA--protein transferase
MIPWLEPGTPFPPVDQALDSPNGLLAATAAVTAPRLVLFTDELRISRSLRRRARAVVAEAASEVRLDRDFIGTMRACAQPRTDQRGTWITEDMIGAYADLNRRGLAHSVELWSHGACVGGLYGVALGRMFYGESMFSRQTDASKIALVALVRLLRNEHVPVIDCQQKTSHLASLGAREIKRAEFCSRVASAVQAPSIDWSQYFNRPLNELLLTD